MHILGLVTLARPQASLYLDTMLRGAQIGQSTSHTPNNAVNCPQAISYQAAQRQRYQSELFCRVYQKSDKKKVYQIDNKNMENQWEGF